VDAVLVVRFAVDDSGLELSLACLYANELINSRKRRLNSIPKHEPTGINGEQANRDYIINGSPTACSPASLSVRALHRTILPAKT
jgi:hypothetical protein